MENVCRVIHEDGPYDQLLVDKNNDRNRGSSAVSQAILLYSDFTSKPRYIILVLLSCNGGLYNGMWLLLFIFKEKQSTVNLFFQIHIDLGLLVVSECNRTHRLKIVLGRGHNPLSSAEPPVPTKRRAKLALALCRVIVVKLFRTINWRYMSLEEWKVWQLIKDMILHNVSEPLLVILVAQLWQRHRTIRALVRFAKLLQLRFWDSHWELQW